MISDAKPFETNLFFSGGAGIFIQYHDIVKPVYLYTIAKMIITEESFGLPLDMINQFSFLSIIEWYMNRRYRNPLKCLDYQHYATDDQLDDMLQNILKNDQSIYRLAPTMNISRLMYVYKKQHMSCPIYVYSEHEEPYVQEDCKSSLYGNSFKYLHGDLKECISKCDQNFTYIFSDIELVKSAVEILTGTCSHIIVADDYRYNYNDYFKTFHYDLRELMLTHPFLRIGTLSCVNQKQLALSINNIRIGGDS